MGFNQAAPGYIYPLIKPSSNRPYFLLAGDGSEGVHLMTPTYNESNAYAYSASKILELGGTVGSLAVGEADANGQVNFVAPDYDGNKLYLYKLL